RSLLIPLDSSPGHSLSSSSYSQILPRFRANTGFTARRDVRAVNAGLSGRVARREEGRRRVSVVTRLVAIGATAAAVVAGVAFAQQPVSSGTGTGAASDGGVDTDDGSNPEIGTPYDGSGSGSPSITLPGSGSAHGSSGGS